MDIQDKNNCTIYIVRHGETEWNVARRIQGQEDSPLTETGKQQARELGENFRDIHFDGIFSSDLLRAKRTAEIITLERKLAVITTELIRERSFGKFEGKSLEELRQFDDTLNMLTDEERHTHKLQPNIESDEEIAERFILFVREIAVRYTGKTLLMVTHGAILRSFLLHIGYATYKQLPWYGVKNTAYIQLSTDGVDFFVKETSGIILTNGDVSN